MTAYNTISLFSGAMGLDLGIEKVGFKIWVCVEKDKWAAQTIRANTSIHVIERDINDVPTDEILAAAGIGRQDVLDSGQAKGICRLQGQRDAAIPACG